MATSPEITALRAGRIKADYVATALEALLDAPRYPEIADEHLLDVASAALRAWLSEAGLYHGDVSA